MLPPEFSNPSNLLMTAATAVGLAVGAAVVYVKNNWLKPSQAKTTDLIVAGGSIVDMTEFRELRKDITRCAVALEELAKIRRERDAEEELEDKIEALFDKLARRTKKE
jgi:hypothetical protein